MLDDIRAMNPSAGIEPQPVRLAGLDFTDLYLRLDKPDESRYRPVKRGRSTPGNQAVPLEVIEELEVLRRQAIDIRKDEFSMVHDGMRLRGSRQTMSTGQVWIAFRRVSDEVPSLENLNIADPLVGLLRGLGRRSGLILIAGATGHGKTTTATSLLTDYLTRHGDLAYTIEDPVEFQLTGEHGNGGYCFQVEIDQEFEWAQALRTALRWHPRYLLVGEVRSSDAANQVLRAATSGHLVLTTMHGGSLEEGLGSLLQLGQSALGERAAQLLADGLVAVLHQTLRSYGPYIRFLTTEEGNPGDPVRAAIRDRKLHLLGTTIEQQEAQLFGPEARLRRMAAKRGG